MEYLRLQSAMEYLMTYGWAILIIAVVLGALFGLGFFNSANLAPKVGPGSCQVYRPNGPGSSSFVNLEGTCNNELPQYVASFNVANVIIGAPSSLVFQPPVTISAWVYGGMSGVANQEIVGDWETPGQKGYGLFWTDSAGNINFLAGNVIAGLANRGQYNNGWHFFVGTANSAGGALYIDGQQIASTSTAPGTVNTNEIWQIGFGYGLSPLNYFSGRIANVQIYNSSLSANEVVALYQEGIGGVPVLPQNLVAWWPLNGNSNDYSGNQNNGVPANVVYTTSWTSGYTAP